MGKTLEELKAAKAARDAQYAAADEALELQELQLDDEFSEKLGRRGVDFEIVSTAKGLFVVKKPDFLTAKRFNAAENKSEEDVIQFVLPCVAHPERQVFQAVVVEHGGIAYRCAMAMLKMYEARAEERGKKY